MTTTTIGRVHTSVKTPKGEKFVNSEEIVSEYTLNHGELAHIKRQSSPTIQPNSLEEWEALAAIDTARYEEERAHREPRDRARKRHQRAWTSRRRHLNGA